MSPLPQTDLDAG